MKTMLISVGGADAPIINSIKTHSPDKIIFFVSKVSRPQVSEKIMPPVFDSLKRMIDHEFIVTPDEQDIGTCTGFLLSEVPKAMKKLGCESIWPEIVDYTGGTKTMSAAVVWASSKFPCLFNYVGGTERSKNGLGIVLDGTEKHVTLQNPWDRLAYFEINDAMNLFDCAQYANSAEMFAKIAKKVSDESQKRSLSLLTSIVEAYSQWDIFEHKKALSILSKNIEHFKDMVKVENIFLPNLEEFTSKTEENFDFLKGIDKKPFFIVYDLLANALRRAELEKKYEDATARTYAAIEKIAKLELKMTYGIDNSKCRPDQLPDILKSEYSSKYLDKNNLLQFGCISSFELLSALGNIYGKRFVSLSPEVGQHLNERNNSILGHGAQSMNNDKFQALFNDALSILKEDRCNLPVFPKFIEK